MRATADACAAAMADLISPESGAAGNGAITESEEPPAAAAIAQPDHSAATFGPKEDFSDNSGPPGQTFTPKTAFWLKAITVKGFANSPQSFGQGPFGRVTLSISQLDDGGVLKRLRQESATGGFSNGGAYQTFTLASPLVLAAGKTYAYDLFTEQGFYGFAKSASDVYAGGAAMQHGDAPRISADGAPLTKAQASDRTFFINPVASESGGKPALERAFAQRPSVIVLVSGRAYDETFASRVLAMRNAERVKLNVVLVGDAGADVKGMRRIVEGSGGEYRQITADGVARGG